VIGAVGSGDFGGGAESSFEGRITGAAGSRAGGLGGGGAFGMGNSLWTIFDWSATELYWKSDAHTLCSFCKMFSNTRGHSDLSSWVRIRVRDGARDELRDLHVDGTVASCLLQNLVAR
jgi:hypothetical protein